MLSRFRGYESVVGLVALVSALGSASCGGAPEPVKTAATDSAKKTAEETKPAAPSDASKAGDKPVDNGADKPADKPAAQEPQPAKPREKFAVANVEFMDADERKKVTFGGKDLSAEACMLDTSVPDMKDEWFSNAMRGMAAAPDGSLYVIDNNKMVRHYIPQAGDSCKLGIDATFGDKGILKLPEDPERLFVLADGTLVANSWNSSQKIVNGKVESFNCHVDEIFADGKSGMQRAMDQLRRIDISGGCKETEWKYTGWEPPKPEKGKDPISYSVQRVIPWDKDFLLHVSLVGDHYLGIHSADGKLKVKIGKDANKDKDVKEGEDICWAADMGKCSSGLCVLDSNCRRLTSFDPKKGSMVESIKLRDLLGLSYPWPVAMVSTTGFTYIAVTNPEIKPLDAPKDAKEISHALIFRVKGLN